MENSRSPEPLLIDFDSPTFDVADQNLDQELHLKPKPTWAPLASRESSTPILPAGQKRKRLPQTLYNHSHGSSPVTGFDKSQEGDEKVEEEEEGDNAPSGSIGHDGMWQHIDSPIPNRPRPPPHFVDCDMVCDHNLLKIPDRYFATVEDDEDQELPKQRYSNHDMHKTGREAYESYTSPVSNQEFPPAEPFVQRDHDSSPSPFARAKPVRRSSTLSPLQSVNHARDIGNVLEDDDSPSMLRSGLAHRFMRMPVYDDDDDDEDDKDSIDDTPRARGPPPLRDLPSRPESAFGHRPPDIYPDSDEEDEGELSPCADMRSSSPFGSEVTIRDALHASQPNLEPQETRDASLAANSLGTLFGRICSYIFAPFGWLRTHKLACLVAFSLLMNTVVFAYLGFGSAPFNNGMNSAVSYLTGKELMYHIPTPAVINHITQEIYQVAQHDVQMILTKNESQSNTDFRILSHLRKIQDNQCKYRLETQRQLDHSSIQLDGLARQFNKLQSAYLSLVNAKKMEAQVLKLDQDVRKIEHKVNKSKFDQRKPNLRVVTTTVRAPLQWYTTTKLLKVYTKTHYVVPEGFYQAGYHAGAAAPTATSAIADKHSAHGNITHQLFQQPVATATAAVREVISEVLRAIGPSFNLPSSSEIKGFWGRTTKNEFTPPPGTITKIVTERPTAVAMAAVPVRKIVSEVLKALDAASLSSNKGFWERNKPVFTPAVTKNLGVGGYMPPMDLHAELDAISHQKQRVIENINYEANKRTKELVNQKYKNELSFDRMADRITEAIVKHIQKYQQQTHKKLDNNRKALEKALSKMSVSSASLPRRTSWRWPWDRATITDKATTADIADPQALSDWAHEWMWKDKKYNLNEVSENVALITALLCPVEGTESNHDLSLKQRYENCLMRRGLAVYRIRAYMMMSNYFKRWEDEIPISVTILAGLLGLWAAPAIARMCLSPLPGIPRFRIGTFSINPFDWLRSIWSHLKKFVIFVRTLVAIPFVFAWWLWSWLFTWIIRKLRLRRLRNQAGMVIQQQQQQVNERQDRNDDEASFHSTLERQVPSEDYSSQHGLDAPDPAADDAQERNALQGPIDEWSVKRFFKRVFRKTCLTAICHILTIRVAKILWIIITSPYKAVILIYHVACRILTVGWLALVGLVARIRDIQVCISLRILRLRLPSQPTWFPQRDQATWFLWAKSKLPIWIRRLFRIAPIDFAPSQQQEQQGGATRYSQHTSPAGSPTRSVSSSSSTFSGSSLDLDAARPSRSTAPVAAIEENVYSGSSPETVIHRSSPVETGSPDRATSSSYSVALTAVSLLESLGSREGSQSPDLSQFAERSLSPERSRPRGHSSFSERFHPAETSRARSLSPQNHRSPSPEYDSESLRFKCGEEIFEVSGMLKSEESASQDTNLHSSLAAYSAAIETAESRDVFSPEILEPVRESNLSPPVSVKSPALSEGPNDTSALLPNLLSPRSASSIQDSIPEISPAIPGSPSTGLDRSNDSNESRGVRSRPSSAASARSSGNTKATSTVRSPRPARYTPSPGAKETKNDFFARMSTPKDRADLLDSPGPSTSDRTLQSKLPKLTRSSTSDRLSARSPTPVKRPTTITNTSGRRSPAASLTPRTPRVSNSQISTVRIPAAVTGSSPSQPPGSVPTTPKVPSGLRRLDEEIAAADVEEADETDEEATF